MNAPQSPSGFYFYHNSGKEWLIAGILAAVLFVICMVVRRVLMVQFADAATRSKSEVDQAIADMVKRTRPLFLLVVALYFGSHSLTFPPPPTNPIHPTTDFERVQQVFELIFLLQCALWGSGLVAFFTERSLAKREDGTDSIGIGAIRMLGLVAKLVVWVVLGITAIKLVDSKFDISAVLTAGAVGGLAIALAVQNILGDFLATLAIVFDRPFDVGDSIAVDQISGTVEKIGLKTTRLRSVTGEEVILPNGDLLKSRLRNFNRMVERRVTLGVDLSFDTPPDVLERIPGMLAEIIKSEPGVRFDRSHFATVTDSAFHVEVVYYVLDKAYVRFMDMQQAINLTIVKRFDAEKIRFAFPTRLPYEDDAPTTATGAPATPAASTPGAQLPTTAAPESTPRPPQSTGQ